MAEDDVEIDLVDGPEDVVEVDANEEDERDEPFFYDDSAANMVSEFQAHDDGRRSLREISRQVRADFDEAWESSEEYRKRKAKDWKVFTGDLPEKTFPFENCANAHAPIALENITRLQFRAAGELFGDWMNVFGVMPVGPDDQLAADMLSKHGNWQIRERIPDFARQQHRGLLMFFLHGDVTCHSYYDMTTNTNRHDMITCDEFVTPYNYVSLQPDYADAPFYVKVLSYHKHELERYEDLWEGVRDVINGEQPSWEDEPEQLLRVAAEEVEGIRQPSDTKHAPFRILQYEGWMDLPNQDRQRFVQVIQDFSTGNIMSLTVHEEKSWEDLERLERQEAELSAYREQRSAYDQAAALDTQARDGLQDNAYLTPEEALAVGGFANQQAPLPPPPPPAWMQDPSDPEEGPPPARMVPIRMFAHAVCIEPLVGNLGFGFGRIQTDFNRAANTMLSQFIDAATLNNAKGIITAGDVEFDRPFSLSPGVVNKVTGVSGSELRQSIMPIEVGPANPQLMDGVNLMYQWGQSSIQSPSVLSGEPGKSGETFRGISARIEQATKQLSVATQKYADPFLTQILRNNAKLNAHFLDDEEFFLVNDHQTDPATGLPVGPRQEKVGRALYRRNYKVEIRADLKFGTDAARIADADQLVQAAMNIPQLQANPAFVYAAVKKALEARDQHDMVEKLGPQPPDPVVPMGAAPQPMPGAEGPPGPQPGEPTQ